MRIVAAIATTIDTASPRPLFDASKKTPALEMLARIDRSTLSNPVQAN